MAESRKQVLVLGGSTFMGLQLLNLLEKHENPAYDVMFINRGKKYWNGKVKELKKCEHVFGNRKEKLEFSRLLEYESEKKGIDGVNKKWAAVFDFCAFKYSEVKTAYEALKGKVDLYLFISTDSIYDSCDPSVRKEKKIKEEYACRPTTLRKIEKLKESDEYAHNKLKCEEYLYNFIEKEQFPFVVLRLPDVIGPYDDTGRFWAYIKWIKNYSENPILMDNEAKNQQMSLVYSQDVAELCVRLIEKVKDAQSDILYKSYNIACNENITLQELLKKIGSLSGVSSVNLKSSDSASKFYPSVDCGPIDISRAQTFLGWNPTPLNDVLEVTVKFFLEAKGKYREEEKYADKKLLKKMKQE